MSKKKKTIEELLEEALLPEEEQPYEVPENWIWVKFDSVIKTSSNRASAIKQKDYEEQGRIPVIDQGMQLISGYTNNQENEYTGELPVIVFGDHTRCLKWIDFSFAQGADGTKLLKPLKHFYPKYFYYLLKIINLPNKGYSRHFKYLRASVLPIPPLNEQKRIVEKVERLLDKIEEAKQLIEEAKETFELRRAAILDKAFRGELSKGLHVKEKNENNEDEIEFNHNNEEFYELPYNWRWVSLESVCETITDGDHQAPPKSEEGIPFLVISNINKGVLDFQKTRFVPKEYYNKLHAKRKPKVGDVLYSVTGSYGIPVLVDTDKEFCFQRHIAILKPSEDIRSKYLYYILKSRLVYNQATNYATGTAQLTVPLSGLRKIKIPLPSLNEQNYIVGKIERMFNKQAYAEKFCIISNENIEVLKQSILSKAFKGELGTNNPSEENAIELLKQVLQEQVK
ncbi:hypothetical protein CJ481_11800 [Bacillus subtilis]|nr:hypothetical protein CJ481_11800 [Bacillus subtilis]